ncbi:MAG: M28 family peptidase [Candidatus Saccharimonadaceae bacterium]
MRLFIKYISCFRYVVIIMLFVSCNFSLTKKSNKKETVVPNSLYAQISPDFNSDSAYLYIKNQVNFGPRVPNSTSHLSCGNYLVSKLKELGAQVTEQKIILKTFDGVALNARNIIGVYNPENERRVLLFAHWDSRPFADQEMNTINQLQPIPGANDGASGVGVLLEIARQLNKTPVNVGVDIILFDAEDWGPPSYEKNLVQGEWWCLGSQYWAKSPHVPNYKAEFGILLDMVGSSNATFYKEGYSVQYASNIIEKVWQKASYLGYGDYFINKQGGFITDDHVAVNQFHRAPSINLIHTSEDSQHGFGEFWHTHNDDMKVIDKRTLKAVGQTVLEIIYTEK